MTLHDVLLALLLWSMPTLPVLAWRLRPARQQDVGSAPKYLGRLN
jgi:hypothetical protein